MTLRQINDLIDAATEPGKMSAREALDFLEELRSDLDGKIDALRSETG